MTSNTGIRVPRRAVICTLALFALLPPAARPEPPNPAVLELPQGLEAAVSEQLEGLRDLAEAAFEDPETSEAERAEAIGELGRHLHAYGLDDAARAAYEAAAELAPRDFRWPYLLGYLAQGQGRLEDAAALYEKALAVVPGVPPTLIRMAAVYVELGKTERAEWLYREAIRSNPTSAAALAGLGELLLSGDRPEEAAQLLQRALELAPEANRLYYPLALAYRELGEAERARELMAWRGSVGVKPADPVIDALAGLKTGERVHLLQGQSAFRVGRYAEAAEQFRRAIEINPNSISGWVDLGSALGQQGNASEAIAAFERAVELAPGNETALYNLGVLLSRRGELDRAIDLLSQAGQFAPADGQLRFELARAMRLAGRWEDSILHYDAAIAALPGLEAPRLGKAQALARLGRLAEARVTLEAALDSNPQSLVLALALSRILASAEDPEVRDAERAVQLALKIFESRTELSDAEWVAETLAQADRCEEAAGWQREVIEQATEAGQPAALLARLQENLARFAGGAPCRSGSSAP